MEKFKFITPKQEGENLVWIRALKPFLDIEITSDLKTIKKSKKPLILWNPYAYLTIKGNSKNWKYRLYQNFKKNNKPIYILERGYLPESLYLDKYGVLVDSISYNENKWNYPLTKEQLEQVKQFIEHFKIDKKSLERQGSNRISKKTFLRKIKAKGYKKIVFVPLQKNNDTVTRKWCDWVNCVNNFKLIIKRLAKKQNDILFLVKAHPLRPQEKMMNSKNVRNIDNLHYKDCIQYSDAVITINSSVGMQAMMWEKPVIIVGKAFFQIKDINYKAHNLKEIVDLIYNAKTPDMEKVEKFIYYLQYNFYSHCTMRKHPHRPIKVDRVVFEHPFTDKKIILEE